MADGSPAAFIYSEAFQRFDYGPAHPLRIRRLALTAALCEAYGLLEPPGVRRIEARPATVEELAAFHTPAYLELLRRAEAEPDPGALRAAGLGTGDNPIFPGLFDWACLSAGATLQAMELVDGGETRRAFSMAGGLHHAGAGRASGFCYVNDPAVCIAHLLRRGRRVAYVDIDAHHGDGVEQAFYDSDRVLTISLHETGACLFPGTGAPEETGRGPGVGYAVNVPLLPGTDDPVFLWALEAVAAPLLAAFRPDITVLQLGTDAHRDDPLAHLALSLDGFAAAVARLATWSDRCIALGGGGYDVEVVARGWTAAWATLAGRPVADELPAAFRQGAGRGFRAHRLSDHPRTADPALREQTWAFAREQVRRVQRLAFPYHGLSGPDPTHQEEPRGHDQQRGQHEPSRRDGVPAEGG